MNRFIEELLGRRAPSPETNRALDQRWLRRADSQPDIRRRSQSDIRRGARPSEGRHAQQNDPRVGPRPRENVLLTDLLDRQARNRNHRRSVAGIGRSSTAGRRSSGAGGRSASVRGSDSTDGGTRRRNSGSVENEYVNSRYRVGSLVSAGDLGDVYMGVDRRRDRDVAIKFEISGNDLENEAYVYEELNRRKFSGFPRMHFFGLHSNNQHVLVMDRLGRNMEYLVTETRNGFHDAVIAMIMIQALNRLEDLHTAGFIHRDLKPSNIVCGRPSQMDDSKMYLIDFGNAASFRDTHGRHIPYGTVQDVAGNHLFSPIAWHRERLQGRKDDLESLAYIMVYLRRKKLPWSRLNRSQDVLNRKVEMSSEDLFNGMSHRFMTYLNRVLGMEYDERPDYSGLRRLMRKILSDASVRSEDTFPWVRAMVRPRDR